MPTELTYQFVIYIWLIPRFISKKESVKLPRKSFVIIFCTKAFLGSRISVHLGELILCIATYSGSDLTITGKLYNVHTDLTISGKLYKADTGNFTYNKLLKIS